MYHIIVNPIAGKGRTLSILPILTALFDKQGISCTWLQTDAPMDAYHKTLAICKEGSDGIIGIGGDGTMQEIVAGMAAAFPGTIPIPLGIMACGSGNDFIFSVAGKKKISPEIDVPLLFNGILNNRTRRVDVIKTGDMAYINIANMGLDARIVQNALRFKKSFGQYAYYAAVLKSIAHHTNLKLSIEVNGEKMQGAFTLVAVCNGQYYGGGMRIAPSAVIDDGKITLCIVDKMSRLNTLSVFPSILMENHTKLNAVRFIECEKVIIDWQGSETLCLDGNLYPRKGPVIFEMMAGALYIFEMTEGI